VIDLFLVVGLIIVSAVLALFKEGSLNNWAGVALTGGSHCTRKKQSSQNGK